MSIATINTLRPSSQPRDQLVLQVENVALAGRRLLTIEIFEVPDAGPVRATTPLSPHRSPPSTPTNSDRNSGFRVAARDEVENEYSLFVGRQRAEYLYRSEYGTASETMTSEDMANGILAHLSIIGNRHRDVGVLVCKEPEAHFKKKIRILPVNTPPEKQKNPHLPSKRQDQRAVRIQKTSKRTMEAVAKAMKQTDRHLSGDNESIGNDIHSGVKFDRKSSEASILHRMAVGDSKPMWKAELETNYEESDRSSSFIEEDEDSIHKDKSYMLAPGLSPVKRALPERKTKHKDLEERRQKGRQQRIFVAQLAQEAIMLGLQGSHDQDSYSTLIEETENDISQCASRRSSMVAVSNVERRDSQPRASSAPRTSVGNAYALKNLPISDLSEPTEQFIRRRTLDTHRTVLKDDHWQDDILGKNIEITDQRPTLLTPSHRLDPLLNGARRVMMVNTVGSSFQRSASSLVEIPDKYRSRTSTSPCLYSPIHNAPDSVFIRESPKVGNESERVNIVAARKAQAGEPQFNSSTETDTPRSQTKSTSVTVSSHPSSETNSPRASMSADSSEILDTLSSNVKPTGEIATEDVSPKSTTQSKLEENRTEMQRPRSNSVGTEGIQSLSPLSSTTKPSVQEFLAPLEAQDATVPVAIESEIVAEKEIPVPPLDPEIVFYSPTDLTTELEEISPVKREESVAEQLTVNTLSYQAVMNDIQAHENENILPVVISTTEIQDDHQKTSLEALPSVSQQDLVSPQPTRQGCWDEVPAFPIISPDDREKPIASNLDKDLSETAMVVSPQQETPRSEENEKVIVEKETIDLQQLDRSSITDNQTQAISARLSGNEDQEEQNDNDTPGDLPVFSPDEQVASMEKDDSIAETAVAMLTQQHNSDLEPVELQLHIENVIPDNQTQVVSARTYDNKDQDGHYDEAVKVSKEISVPTTLESSNCSEDVDELALGNHIMDDDIAVRNDPENADQLEPTEINIGYQNIKTDRDGESAITTPFVSDSASETSVSPLINHDDTAEHQNNSIIPAMGDLNKIILPSTKKLASSRKPGDQEKYRHQESLKTSKNSKVDNIRHKVVERPQKAEVMHLKQVQTALELIPSDIKEIKPSGRHVQPAAESPLKRDSTTAIARKTSVSPSKKIEPVINTGQAKASSTALSSRRRTSIVKVHDEQILAPSASNSERRQTTDMKDEDAPRALRRTSIDLRNPLPGLSSGTVAIPVAKISDEKSSSPVLRLTTKDEVPPKRHSSEHSKVLQGVTNYHKKWGKWIVGKSIIEKVGCLQLEEFVMADPKNVENLLKLGLRYARCSGTSMPAILLLEHVALLPKNAAGTREYWFCLGSAHLNIFMRHRKYLPVARFHLTKSIRAFTSAFAYLESLVDPVLLLRYAISLFWHKGDGHLEKTRDIFHELFSQFVTFCDKDRPNLLFLQFQVLHRLKLYVDAIDCIKKIIALHDSLSHQPTPPILTGAQHCAVYDAADYHLMLMQCQQAGGDYATAAQSLASVLKLKNIQQETTLRDDEYFDLWCSLAGKCFHHEDYTLALEYYAMALNFAKQSQVLATIHYNIGLCFQSLGEDNKCVTEYKRARTANRHVLPLVSVAELSTLYDEQFAKLLQKSVVQTIDEVRGELYGKAVRHLQRVFRSRRNLNVDSNSNNSAGPLPKMPPLARQRSVILASRNPPSLVKIVDSNEETEGGEENLQQNVTTTDDNQVNKDEESVLEAVERRHELFLVRKQAVVEEMAELLTNPQYRGRGSSPSSRPNLRSKTTANMRSGLLSPEKDRLDARRMQSMDTYRQLGYVSSTMPWFEFWEKLLALASELFESRQALYGSIARIRGRLPLVTDEVAFCALAESIGNVHEAAKKLHDASYERELTYVCAVIEVSKQLERDFPLNPMQLSLKSPHVSLPTISSPRAQATAARTPGIMNEHRVVLPPYSPIRVASESPGSKPKKHLRMNQMLNMHFQEHVQNQEAALAIAEATGEFVPPEHRTEKLMVLQDFRLTNNILLSQLAFGSEKAAI